MPPILSASCSYLFTCLHSPSAPLITSPLSEMYGRILVLQGSNGFFFVFNTACGFAKTDCQMLAFRFLSGIGGCAAQSVR